ncbi:MAG: hypothetical protein KDJ86_14960 [Bauldia sp.]|uniref:hypothetical protein n=1 Tax=Bauldia sp. TaxID=2575872 RepID=UPI001D8BED67|nr:hypothetical protein [Bauldia sp.]MCB1497086.1 hypothetical protein [Bauldia sp.]
MRVGLGRFGKSAAIALAGLLAGVSVASAALPPYWQRTREIERIAGDSRVHDALNGSLIVSITWTGEDRYEVRGEDCVVTVTIVDIPGNEGIAGPRNFDLEPGAPQCQ